MAKFRAVFEALEIPAGEKLKMLKIVELIPHVVEKIWGGQKLKDMKRVSDIKTYQGDLDKVGETWEISLHKDGPSQTKDEGELKTALTKPFHYLVKFIDTQDFLSIQVHPGDDYAKKYENSLGKTECWYILSSEPGAGIYIGMKSGQGKEELEKCLEEKGDVSKLMNFIEVKEGDFFFVPAGTIHAIGKGVTLAEIQQNSGITYRVWDWNRVDDQGVGRELHVKQALDVINFDCDFNDLKNFSQIERKNQCESLIKHEDFEVDLYQMGSEALNLKLSLDKRPHGLLNLDKELIVNGKTYAPYEALVLDGEGMESLTIQTGEEESKVSFLHIY